MTKPTTSFSEATSDTANQMAEQLADKAHSAVSATRRRANSALDGVDEGVDNLRDIAPSAFSRAAAQMEELTRRGMDRARDTSQAVRDQAQRAGDRAVGYIQDEPVKSVLMAVAAGAAVAMLASWFARSRSGRF
ncbi:hypothetical protein AACH06_27565 [Ideonella sp. DXS29W]|uniref:DUF883 domain-containing protein n=1 Tax=Ideonella lacteola TaxID=2984193 RepID=A0ABU9BXL1_9BURK